MKSSFLNHFAAVLKNVFKAPQTGGSESSFVEFEIDEEDLVRNDAGIKQPSAAVAAVLLASMIALRLA